MLQSGRRIIFAPFYKGTVRLQHSLGQAAPSSRPGLQVPFSLLGAAQNQSRDWVIDKIEIGAAYDSDLTLAKKLIKQIGLDLAKDPEYGR